MNSEESLAHAFVEDLPWLAFLYVSEELTPDQVVDFEERLLTDQAAREAVAQAMKMADGIWLASALESLNPKQAMCSATLAEHPTPSQYSKARRLALWLTSTVVAAGLAFGIGWWLAQSEVSPNRVAQINPQVPEGSGSSSEISGLVDGAEQLVGFWSDSQGILAQLEPSSPAEFSEDFPSHDPALDEEDSFAWMLAAVSAETTETPISSPEVMEN